MSALVCKALITVSSCKNHKISIANQYCVSLFRIPNHEDKTKYHFLCKLFHSSCYRFFMRYHYNYHHYYYHYGVTRLHFIPRLLLDYVHLQEMRLSIPELLNQIQTPEIEKFHEDFKVRWLIGSYPCTNTVRN